MEEQALEFLEELSNGFGPPGFEREVLRIVDRRVRAYCDSVSRDKLGSLLFESRGATESPVVLLPGHIDEIGFIISGINDKGFLTFNSLGGWFDQVLLGQRVTVRGLKGDREGVIAAKPPHLLSPEEKRKVIDKTKMFIDLGCSNKREAEEMGIRVGDPAVPSSRFSTMEKTVFEKEGGDRPKGTMRLALGKAFDDRIGTFVAAEVLRSLKENERPHPNRVIGAATVQEEVGARGAATAAWQADPDVALTLEVGIAGDVPGIESHKAPEVMGQGPSLVTYDSSMIPNQALKNLVIETASSLDIPLQLSMVAGGGSDAGAIHKLRAGCPGVVISVPTRHIHSHVGIVSLQDVELCIDLVTELVYRLDRNTVDGLTAL